MILVAHPFGNANVRAVLEALKDVGLLAKFVTTLGWPARAGIFRSLPAATRRTRTRRGYNLPHDKKRRW
ncbi:MAG: hypothetical protein H0X04_08300 [Chthoniobacterales bacterium]|nr:hypothetical protein [Chthoniobacterales bacterium]